MKKPDIVKYRGISWQDYCDQITALDDGQLWRHSQAGDLPGTNHDIDSMIYALVSGSLLDRIEQEYGVKQ